MAEQKLLIIVLFLSVLGVVLLAAILGVTSATLSYLHSEDGRAVQTVTPALGLPGFESYSWEDVIRAARGQHVTFWATSVGNYDTWIDDFLVPQMAKLYGITVERVPMGDEGAVKATDQILAELAAGNTKEGSVGLIWTNGPDFHAQRDQGLLYGPWAYKVPSAVNFDFTSDAIAMDFGQPTAGYELPYNAAQVTFIYEPSCVGNNPPQTMAELVTWVLANPGRFTYAHPGQDYTGAAFIRHFLYEFGGGYAQFDGGYDPVVYRKAVAAAFHQLNRMSAGIYRLPGDNQPYYPPGQSETDNLFATGELCITVSYDPDHAGQLIHTPQPDDVVPFPDTTRCWLPKSGTIGNVNFVAIASNSASILGSVVVADYIASMPAMYKRRSTTPPGIGTIQAYDPKAPTLALNGWDIPFADLSTFPETPSAEALAAAFLPEVDADYATQMSIDWELCIEQGLSVASTSAGGSGALCS